MTNSYFIYNFDYDIGDKKTNSTVIFLPNSKLDIDQLQEELRVFYQQNLQADRTVVISANYFNNLFQIIQDNKEHIFKYVPTLEQDSFYRNLHLIQFAKDGTLKQYFGNGFEKMKGYKIFKKNYFNEGLKILFHIRGGLVETSHNHHHFVFPSGKHSQKFLRTANVLIHSSEISFLAHGLLKYYSEQNFDIIYTDTSSINTVAYELQRILSEFDKGYINVPINSFSSYSGIYDKNSKLLSNSLILISASTSGSIISKLLERHPNLSSKNIVLLFYLANTNHNSVVAEQMLCNLTREGNTDFFGVDTFYQGDNEKCKLCDEGSFPLNVTGDVFLLEQPKVNTHVIGVNEIKIKNLFSFSKEFMSKYQQNTIIKLNYRETKEEGQVNSKYEVFIDYEQIIDNLNRFPKYKDKLDSYIDQYIPSNLLYILHLNDNSSKKLANYIFDRIKDNYLSEKCPEVISQTDFECLKKIKKSGSVLIVGSCISNGHNLLYLSRALRDSLLRIIYFIGINRYPNQHQNEFLKTNLKYGKYGREISSFIEVMDICCTGINGENSWTKEVEFLKKSLMNEDDEELRTFFKDRIKNIENSYSSKIKGLSNNAFLPIPYKVGKESILKIRKNSAFFQGNGYQSHVVQSEVHFCISTVINGMRNNIGNTSLAQSSYVRNLICPTNFNRYNDGVIQASILRSAKDEELNYSLDKEVSARIKDILVTLFKYRKTTQGEALLEFLYAIATNKLRIVKDDLVSILEQIKHEENKLIKFYYQEILKVHKL